jgi:lipoyl(octanoyl) transferase
MKLPEVRPLGRQPYDAVREAMRAFTQARSDDTADEIWLVEHPPVFTQGVAGRDEHLLLPGDIPVLRTERGGQVTYHGPGQVLAYPLVDLKRLGIYVKEFVFRLEGAVLQTLEDFGVTGHRVRGAPGIYVRLDDPFGHAVLPAPPAGSSVAQALQGLGKIAALGIKVSQHRSWHGLALNVAMDLEPFSRIDPCGYAGLKTVDLASLGVPVTWDEASQRLGQRLAQKLS